MCLGVISLIQKLIRADCPLTFCLPKIDFSILHPHPSMRSERSVDFLEGIVLINNWELYDNSLVTHLFSDFHSFFVKH